MGTVLSYDVDLGAREQHLVTVTVHVPADLATDAVLAMATWTPGSYFERHYARFVQQVHAVDADGRDVSIATPDTTRWALAADGSADVAVAFEIYAHELGVRNNHVDDHHALLVGAATFPFLEGHQDLPHRVRFDTDLPVWSLLPEEADGSFAADDHLHLVDSAFEVGDFPSTTWETAGVAHRLVWAGHGGRPDLDRIAEYGRKLTQAAVDLFGELPLERDYTFIAVGSESGGGGLEHRDGSVLMMPVTTFQDPERETTFQSLVTHEYLHLWNVKRLIPEALVSPDLTEPVHTPSLWVAEGWTAFYDEVLPVRAGVWKLDTYLKKLATQADAVLQTPGARLQAVRQASHEAWIKQYIRDENTPNVGVNYYPHGAMLAWCLDLQIRRENPGGAGLDDAVRLLWERFGRTGVGYRERDVQDAVNEAAGTSLDDFFDQYVAQPALPPLHDLVEVVGLRFAPAKEGRVPLLGAQTTEADGGVTFSSVLRGSPAWKAGLTGGDQLLAIDGQRVLPGQLEMHLKDRQPSDRIDVAVFRGPRLLHRTVQLGPEYAPDRLTRVEAPDESQSQAFRAWLGVDLDGVDPA